MVSNVEHTHELKATLHGNVFFPGHPPRRNTPEYNHTHQQLIHVLKKRCHICSLNIDDLTDPVKNPPGSTHRKCMETHHYPIQDSLVDAVDWKKVHQDFSQVISQETLLQFLDSGSNMMVLCDQCHIGYGGIHWTTANYFEIQRYLLDGYVLFDQTGRLLDETAAETVDDTLERMAHV